MLQRLYRDPVVEYTPSITPMQEATLSWLQGRAPVGTWFVLYQERELTRDLYYPMFRSHSNIFWFLRRLERKGYIKTRKIEGRHQLECIVLKTLEQSRSDR